MVDLKHLSISNIQCSFIMILLETEIDLDYFVTVQEHRGDGDAGTSGDGDADSVDDTSEIHFVPQDKGACEFTYVYEL